MGNGENIREKLMKIAKRERMYANARFRVRGKSFSVVQINRKSCTIIGRVPEFVKLNFH